MDRSRIRSGRGGHDVLAYRSGHSPREPYGVGLNAQVVYGIFQGPLTGEQEGEAMSSFQGEVSHEPIE